MYHSEAPNTTRFLKRSSIVQSASESEPLEVFGAAGGAALYRREMWDEVGGMDASFFFALDDVDLAWRARMADWSAIYAPGVRPVGGPI